MKGAYEIDSLVLSKQIVSGMQERKASNIVVMDLREVSNSIVDFFVICSGTSDTQIDSIAESIEKEVLKSAQETPWSKEGGQNKEWIIIDYIDVVAHIFKKQTREFYGLEDLWGDAKVTIIEN